MQCNPYTISLTRLTSLSLNLSTNIANVIKESPIILSCKYPDVAIALDDEVKFHNCDNYTSLILH